ncbi:MAG: hypothetical protein HY706_19805 [Candidatus Hydrogenedentes bacterium]|nr:hypothetical protein [Candidatus Hydrogenedentota bacterium]
MQYYHVSDNSFYTRGFPWIQHITEGVTSLGECPVCTAMGWELSTEITATLRPDKGSRWPDVLGCGAIASPFIVSGKVLEAWRSEAIGEFPNGRVIIAEPFPKKLADTEPPDYFWLQGERMEGAKLDLEASGFVGVQYCPCCGAYSDDIEATYDRQHAQVCPYVFVPGTWNGAHLFTTNLSDAAFFCTEAVLDCARKYRLTNFGFTPIEEGVAAGSKGVKYLK